MIRKLVLDDLPKLRIEDGFVLARVGFALVNDVAPIEPVLQHQIERSAGKMLAAGEPSAGALTALAHETQPVQLGPEQSDRPLRAETGSPFAVDTVCSNSNKPLNLSPRIR